MNKRGEFLNVKTRGELNLTEFKSLTVQNLTQIHPASSGYIFAV